MLQTYETTQTLLTHEADAFGLWRPDAMFRLMQEVAGTHAAKLGYSREALLARGQVWMIARVRLEVARYPRLYDTVRAKTWYGEPGRITYPRYIELTDEAGTALAALATSWVIVDTADRRILLPGKAGLTFPPAAELTPPMEEPGKMRLSKAGEKKVVLRAPQYSDLDVNGHMNNASYVGWILDLFPVTFHQEHRLRSLCISYASEATPDELVELTLFRDGPHFEVLGLDQADGHVVFEAKGAWMKHTA